MVMFFKAKMYITKSLEDKIPHQLRALNIEREMCNNRGKGLDDRLPVTQVCLLCLLLIDSFWAVACQESENQEERQIAF